MIFVIPGPIFIFFKNLIQSILIYCHVIILLFFLSWLFWLGILKIWIEIFREISLGRKKFSIIEKKVIALRFDFLLLKY